MKNSSYFKKSFEGEKKSITPKKSFGSAKNAILKKKRLTLKIIIKKLKRNLRTIIESFGKSFTDQKNAKLKKSVKLEKNYDKKETMLKKKFNRI